MTCMQFDWEQLGASWADGEGDVADSWALTDHRGDSLSDGGAGRPWSAAGDVDSGRHRRLPPSVPELQNLVTSLQLELKQSHASQMRTRQVPRVSVEKYRYFSPKLFPKLRTSKKFRHGTSVKFLPPDAMLKVAHTRLPSVGFRS